MDIIRLSRSPKSMRLKTEPCVIAIGYFDGVHLGHRSVIMRAKTISARENVPLSVLTFDPHPKEVVSQGKYRVDHLTPLTKKAEILAGLGVDKLYIAEFTTAFSKLPPATFVEQYLIGLQAVHVVTGFDFTYGHLGKGNAGTLESDGRGRFAATIVPEIERCGQKISSTLIRNLLRSGDVEQITHFLGNVYAIRGKASPGAKDPVTGAAKTRFAPFPQYTLPGCGVYRIRALVGKKTINALAHVKPGDERPKIVEIEWFGPCPIRSGFTVMEIQWIHRLDAADRPVASAEPVPVNITRGG